MRVEEPVKSCQIISLTKKGECDTMCAHNMRRELHSFRIDPEVWRHLQIMAKQSGMSVSRLMEIEARMTMDPKEETAVLLGKIYQKYYDVIRGKKKVNV